MIHIIDYGLGNVRAFLNVFKRLNIAATTASDAAALAGATKVILPGVGHFDHAMRRLVASGMKDCLDDLVLQAKVPILGVCVGMQMLGRSSDEGSEPGLGWIDGRVKTLASLQGIGDRHLPHMGWNDVVPMAQGGLFDGLEVDPRFYFLHSFYFECARPMDVAANVTYGGEFACAVRYDNIFGVQFHPEKSHHFGSRLLQNFAEM